MTSRRASRRRNGPRLAPVAGAGRDDPAGDGYDCDICRAMGQRVKDDGSIVSTGEVADMDEAVRLIVERGEWLGE